MCCERLRLLIAAFIVLFAIPSGAQDFPTKPIRIVVGGPAGGASDILVRLVGQKMSDVLGQPIVVHNKPGGTGVIGASLAASSAPDGHTLMLTNTSLWAILPSVKKKLPFDPDKFVSVAMFARADSVMLVRSASPFRTLKDLVDHAKANPGKLSYGSSGIATPAHLAAEMLCLYAGLKVVHVPYQGALPALIDMIAGRVDFVITTPITADGHIRNGNLRVLGTTGLTRNPAFPAVAPMADSVAGYEITQSWGISAPVGTPRAAIDKLHSAAQTSLRHPDVQKVIATMGASPVFMSNAEFDKHIAGERRKLADLIARTGISLD